MITDPSPRIAGKRAEYDRSDRLSTLALPADSRLHGLAFGIESAIASGSKRDVQAACRAFLVEAARCFDVAETPVRVLDARPLRVYESGLSELFGDYQLNTCLIRVWMRTAVRKQVTSFGTFLSTLCHEFCHHLDYQRFGFHDSWHTRGFYERTAALYHHARGTPPKRLFWAAVPGGRWRIDWPRTNRGG